MATIGTFIKRGDDLHGAIRTLTLDVDLVVRPIPKTRADGPDFLIYAAGTAKGPNGIDTQLGAGWKRTCDQNFQHIDVELDDPAFPRPLSATLVHDDLAPSGERFSMVWTRGRRGDLPPNRILQEDGGVAGTLLRVG